MLKRREFVLGALGTAAFGTALWSRGGGASAGISGAHGDGATDDTNAVKLALARAAASQLPLDGGDRIYAVRGDLQLAGAIRPWIKSLRVKQLAPAGDRRTLHFKDCQKIRIDRLEIDRGSVRNRGDINSSAGLWIEGGSGHDLRDVDVFGDGTGNGIVLWNVRNGSFESLRVRDMRFDAAGAGDDILQGIWLNRTEDCVLSNASVSNLTGNTERSFPCRYTRGIAAGGNRRLKIVKPQVRAVDQGIDLTGSEGNVQCTVSGGRTSQCTTVGVKLANSAVNCTIVDHIDEDAGMFGFHATGPSEPHLPNKIHDCDFIRCTAVNPGSNRFPFPHRPPGSACGFLIWPGDYDQDFPAGIRFIDCHAQDRQETKTMRYGFYCGVNPSHASTRPNQTASCSSEGHILGAKGGTWG
jgi:hypothetical protein